MTENNGAFLCEPLNALQNLTQITGQMPEEIMIKDFEQNCCFKNAHSINVT